MNIENKAQEFVALIEGRKLFVEALAIADEKDVIFEHYFVPNQPRNIYSHTKSFTSTAVGIAISEGKLSLDDKLAEYFPDKLPANPSPELLNINLRHLLMMSSGLNVGLLFGGDRWNGVGYPDYVSYVLSHPVQVPPGSKFCYSNGDSHMAAKMVEKAVGMPLSSYLYERMFRPLEMGLPNWECDPEGGTFGGSGLRLTVTQMMKIGRLFLNRGMWKGECIVDEAWVKEATSFQIATPIEAPWNNGYGYQWWRSPYPDSYRADGAFGQITTVMPESGLVVSIQCPECGNFSAVREALHEFLSLLARIT